MSKKFLSIIIASILLVGCQNTQNTPTGQESTKKQESLEKVEPVENSLRGEQGEVDTPSYKAKEFPLRTK